MNKQLELCETWNLAYPAYSPHSRLYALEPLGLNTPEVESLTSYMARLAEAHSVSLRTLAKQELLPLLMRDYLSNPSMNCLDAFWVEAARALNGIGTLARDWAQILEGLTLRTDLQFLTLLPWATVLTQQRLLRLNRAWCPDCFSEWQAANRPIYEPLLWNVNTVSVCVRHQRVLLEQCPYLDCQATLPVLASCFRPGYCSKCLRWLGVADSPSNISLRTEQWHWQSWLAKTVGELLSHNMNLTITPHLRNIPELIAAARTQIADGRMGNLGKKLQVSCHTMNAWRSGKQIPQMESILRLCYCCGISLYDLFTSQYFGLHCLGQLETRILPNIPNPTENRRHRTPMNLVYIQKSLEDILAQEEQPPPSMRTVAKRLNHSPKELREHFPELNRAISNRRKVYYKIRREQRLQQMKDEIHRAILKTQAQGLPLSTSRVGLLLAAPFIMRDRVTLMVCREMLDELKRTGKIEA